MPTYQAPGVYVEEVSGGARPIEQAATSIAAFIGVAERGPINKPVLLSSPNDFSNTFGGYLPPGTGVKANSTGGGIHRSYLAHVVTQFFNHGGSRCYVVRINKGGTSAASSDMGLLTYVKAAYEEARTNNGSLPEQHNGVGPYISHATRSNVVNCKA